MIYHIVFEDLEVPVFAAEELQKYIGKITGQLIRRHVKPISGAVNIYVGNLDWIEKNTGVIKIKDTLENDGFLVDVAQNRIILTGNENRSILYAVYYLLESVGCRWLVPGNENEYLPKNPKLRFKEITVVENPDFIIRSMIDDTSHDPLDSYVKETIDKLDWGCKNRANTYSSPGCNLIPGSDPLISWILRELSKRGLMVETGGHGTQNFVDRSLFKSKPELFRMQNGERRIDGNFCSSNIEAIEMVAEGVRRLINSIPGLTVVHLYFDDVFGGSWCDCPNCKDKSPAEQAFNVTNAVCKTLEQEFPEIKIIFVLYHDTIDISGISETPCNNLLGYFAPRERCYAHKVGDPDCRRNKSYFEMLKRAMTILPDIYSMEYYGDMILWNKIGIDIPDVVTNDLRDYYSLGIRRVTILLFNAYSWFAYKLNMLTYVRAAWNLKTDWKLLKKDLCDVMFGNSAEEMMNCYNLREKASKLLLAFCEYDYVSDIRDIPPQQEKFFRQHLVDMKIVRKLWEKCLVIINFCLENQQDTVVCYRLNAEKALLEISISQLDSTSTMMNARFKRHFDGADKIWFCEELDKASEMMRQTKAIGEELPMSLIGINGKGTFLHHLCDDQIGYYNDWKLNDAILQDERIKN